MNNRHLVVQFFLFLIVTIRIYFESIYTSIFWFLEFCSQLKNVTALLTIKAIVSLDFYWQMKLVNWQLFTNIEYYRLIGYIFNDRLWLTYNFLVLLKFTWKYLGPFRGGRKGLRWCGFALFLVQFCGNFYFNLQYCNFKTLSGLQLLQPLSRSFQWKK